jgi:hypothetical protein
MPLPASQTGSTWQSTVKGRGWGACLDAVRVAVDEGKDGTVYQPRQAFHQQPRVDVRIALALPSVIFGFVLVRVARMHREILHEGKRVSGEYKRVDGEGAGVK